VKRRGLDSTPGVSIRNLEDIRERDPYERPSRLSALIMASFGGACIVFAALALMRGPSGEQPEQEDPLGDLLSAAQPIQQAGDGHEVGRDDVTFPAVLSDQGTPTTAMEMVRSTAGQAPVLDGSLTQDAAPPPATDRLPVVPLPAQDVLHSKVPSNAAPSDTLRAMATEVAREPEGKLSEAGHRGGYQLQVSSFKKQEDADRFALQLRRRGHRSYVEKAHVKGRGLWHRVRIGPFKYKRSAELYRQDFEAKERMVTFVVDPPRSKVHIGLRD
jgi:cell division septation protein DedD